MSVQNLKWKFKNDSDRVISRESGFVIINFSRYGDGSKWSQGQSWFYIELTATIAQKTAAQFKSQLNLFENKNRRRFQIERGDGHCGFWVVVRQVIVLLGIVTESELASADTLARAHLYLSQALLKHAHHLATLLLSDTLASGVIDWDGGGLELMEDGRFIDATITGPPHVRSEARKIKFVERREQELKERATVQISDRSRLAFLPKELWFGGLEYTDVRAVCIESKKTWAWINKNNTQVIIVSPLGTITRVALCHLIVDKDAVVSIFNGDHFDSFVNE